jgi:hypothetical protein
MGAETVNSLSFIADSSLSLMTVSHLSQKISYFGRNLRKTDVPLYVGLLRLNSGNHSLETKDVLPSEV